MRVLRRLGLSSRVIGLDVYVQYLKNIKVLKIYDDRILASAKYLPFKEKAFDSVICFQIIEHLSKRDGMVALSELSKVADIGVVTTPVSFVKADVDPRNPFQKHKSGWYPEDFEQLGFRVKGYGWFKISRHLRLAPILIIMNIILFPILRRSPRFAYHMHAVKAS
jgi:ubiquinone/menaquinone biosynthesis C-methylase UbiE